MDKKQAWADLRKVRGALDKVSHFAVSSDYKTGFFVQTRQLLFKMEHRIIFTRMKQAARNKKGVRQAYRYGIAAGLFHGGISQLSGKVFYRGPGCHAEMWPGDEDHKNYVTAKLKAKHEYLNDPRRFAWMR